jgi:CP family cyanate transporter-like MFS transporter
MTDATNPTVRSGALRLPLLWLLGVQLRLTVLAVPPVLPLIHRDLSLSEKAIGALSALPVLLLGLAALPGSLGVARLGARRACLFGLAIVAVAGAARGIGPSVPMLYGMTFAMGAGIALMQPTLPSLVGEWFPSRAGLATAVYANGLLISEALPPMVTIPLLLPLIGGSWEWSFVVWSIPVAVTWLLLVTTTPHRPRERPAGTYRWWPDWRGALPPGMLLGGTGGVYFLGNTFIPEYLHATGQPELVSAALGALNLGQLPASLLSLAFARRITGSRAVLIASPLAACIALLAFLSPLPGLIVAAAGLIGFCCGLQLIVSLALPPLLVSPEDVHHLSAGTFAIGYLTSFLMPPLGGAIWDTTGVPATSFLAGVVCTILVIGAALTLPTLRTAPAGSARRR